MTADGGLTPRPLSGTERGERQTAVATIEGADNLRRVLAVAEEFAGGACIRWAEGEFRSAIREIQRHAQKDTPIDEGTLRRSAKTEGRIQGRAFVGSIRFGGMAAAYAEVQHEREDFEHPKGGRAHYLYGEPDSAWEANEGRVAAELEGRLGRMLEAGMRG
jgi:hypothetical protein